MSILITPCLWFDDQAEEAAQFYISAFGKGEILSAMRIGSEVLHVDFTIKGQRLGALNGGSYTRHSSAISLFATLKSIHELQQVWDAFAADGVVQSPLSVTPWSECYGCIVDKYGITWHVSLGRLSDVGNCAIVPYLLFGGSLSGQAEAAMQRYLTIFPDSHVMGIVHHNSNQGALAGTVQHAQFTLGTQVFMASDEPSNVPHSFTEAISFVVHCEDQDQIDFYWEQLTSGGGKESVCGWLKDPFGISWQIDSVELQNIMEGSDAGLAAAAFANMLDMRKLVINDLVKEPYQNVITVQATIRAPIHIVFDAFTKCEHITHWNAASNDWYCPAAVNDLQANGRFCYTMAARDGSVQFDFTGTFRHITPPFFVIYTLDDGRRVNVSFRETTHGTHVVEVFEAELTHPLELQQSGWQAILNNFKRYAESLTD